MNVNINTTDEQLRRYYEFTEEDAEEGYLDDWDMRTWEKTKKTLEAYFEEA